MTDTLQGALQQQLRDRSGATEAFNGDLVAAAAALGLDAGSATGAAIGLAQELDPTIADLPGAINALMSDAENLPIP